MASASPRFDGGDTGVFGLPLTDSWSFSAVGQTLNSLDDAYSVGFTAFENMTIDRALQRFIQADAGTTLRIGIQSAAPNGLPSGAWLSSAVINPTDGDSLAMATFGSVSLTAGNVYHLVTQPETLGAGESMFVYASGSSNAHRPYDRALDPAHHRNTRTNGGAWTASTGDGFVVFANGADTAFVAPPSQPYGTMGSSTVLTQGGSGSRTGTEFTITTGEVPAGATVRISDVTLRLSKGANLNVNQTLTLAVRELDGTLLGSVAVPVNTIPAGANTLTWNFAAPFDLLQGQTYLFTTSYAGGSVNNDIISLYVALATSPAGAGDAGWQGRVAIRTASDNWSTHTTTASIGDLPVSFHGLVIVPEPATGALGLAGAAGLLLRRRRR
jgi:hypothetical protein